MQLLRTPEIHKTHCAKLKGPSPDFYSVNYGVNRPAILNKLSHYHVCDMGLPPDIMHDILEGVLTYTTKLLLQHFIDNQVIFFKCLVDQFSGYQTTVFHFGAAQFGFHYGYPNSANKPSSIARNSLYSSERQS